VQVGSRLHAPEKAEAFHTWSEEWRRTKHRLQLKALAEREAGAQGDAQALAAELAAVRAACNEQLTAVADEKALALKRLRIELTGSSDERAAMVSAKEREERVALMTRQMTRRMMFTDLATGFSAWTECWQAKCYALQRLKEVSTRGRIQGLSAAFARAADLIPPLRMSGRTRTAHWSIHILHSYDALVRTAFIGRGPILTHVST
jgi:hypothetical protein